MKHEKACGAVIVRDGHILLVHQQNDLWGFPKGHVEPDETEEQTALREVKEETGLDVQLDLATRYSFSYYIQSLDVDKEVVLFLAQLTDPTSPIVNQEAEIAESRWVPFSEVDNLINFPEWHTAWHHFHSQLK